MPITPYFSILWSRISRSIVSNAFFKSNIGRPMAGSVNAEKVCFNCNQSGHIAKYCRKGQFNYHSAMSNERSTRKICFNCQQPGHISSVCPSKYN